MKISGKNSEYEIGDIVAENSEYRIRSCTNSDGRELLFQVAIDASKNAGLSRNAWILTKLSEISDKTELVYGEHGGNPPLNYNLGFPEICDSLVLKGSRQANFIGFREVEKLVSVIPLVKLWKPRHNERPLRVDLRTSAWIMGKLLKTISFAHDNRIEIRNITGNNVLIEPDIHYVLVFNWADAIIHDNAVPASIVREEIKLAAQLVINALGDDLEKARVNDADLSYTKYLQLLAIDGESSALKAHHDFYEIIDSLCVNQDSVWEPKFYKFATLPR